MKKYFILLLLIGLFVSCHTSEKLLRQGEYEQAVEVAVKKLQRNPNNTTQAEILAQAYPKAVEKINERIKFLKQEGKPQNWEEIYRLYLKLKDLQFKVETVTPVNLGNKTIAFDHKDYDRDIIYAKNKAAEYNYAMAKKLMKENNKYAYRQAYEYLMRVKQYDPTYPDLDRLMQICLEKGTTYVLITPVNKTIYRIPDDFLFDLVNIPTDRLNSQWVIYNTQDVRNGDYDVIIYVVLKNAKISANQQKEENFQQTRKVADGYHIEKDSAGNEIKVTDYKQVSCKVRKITQMKVAHIYAELQYYNNRTGQVMRTVPVAADHVFQNAFAVWSGDKRACSDEVLELSNNRILPFPNDYDMIIGAQNTLKKVIWGALVDNKRFLEQRV